MGKAQFWTRRTLLQWQRLILATREDPYVFEHLKLPSTLNLGSQTKISTSTERTNQCLEDSVSLPGGRKGSAGFFCTQQNRTDAGIHFQSEVSKCRHQLQWCKLWRIESKKKESTLTSNKDNYRTSCLSRVLTGNTAGTEESGNPSKICCRRSSAPPKAGGRLWRTSCGWNLTGFISQCTLFSVKLWTFSAGQSNSIMFCWKNNTKPTSKWTALA